MEEDLSDNSTGSQAKEFAEIWGPSLQRGQWLSIFSKSRLPFPVLGHTCMRQRRKDKSNSVQMRKGEIGPVAFAVPFKLWQKQQRPCSKSV